MRSLFTKKRTYLDWASAAPVSKAAKDAFMETVEVFGNPSSPHAEGVTAKAILEQARTSVARLSAVKARNVIFTSGATESNALAIEGRIKKIQQAGVKQADMHVLYLPTMHSSVTKTVIAIKELGVSVEEIPLQDGAIDLPVFKKLLRPETVLVCVDAVCGETGMRFDTLRMKRAIEALETEHFFTNGCVLHVDASQLPLIEDINHTRLGADLLMLDAQKVGGVRGAGALIMATHSLISARTQGGGQEEGLRPGTEPVALIKSFATALEECAQAHVQFSERAGRDRAMLIERITQALPLTLVNEGKNNAPHILNLSFPGLDTDYAVMLLDARGFALSTKSACETDSVEGSVPVQILTGDVLRAHSTLRISWGTSTSSSQLKRFARELLSTIRFLETHAI